MRGKRGGCHKQVLPAPQLSLRYLIGSVEDMLRIKTRLEAKYAVSAPGSKRVGNLKVLSIMYTVFLCKEK